MKENTLFEWAFFPKYNEAIRFLAEEMAEDEQWDFSYYNENNKKYSILKSYLEHTFKKIKEEKKIKTAKQNKYAAFNTGLFTKYFEEIYAFFEKYKNPRPGFSTPFCFKAFLKESNGELLRHFSSDLPERADYFQNPSRLIFNPKLNIIIDRDHIIEDNIHRFPSYLQNAHRDAVRRVLDGATQEAQNRAKANYKIAVPQYYNGKIQLLLPLYLTEGAQQPDLALAIQPLEDDKAYIAKTCLTLRMAYNNARLIVKPHSDWLRP